MPRYPPRFLCNYEAAENPAPTFFEILVVGHLASANRRFQPLTWLFAYPEPAASLLLFDHACESVDVKRLEIAFRTGMDALAYETAHVAYGSHR